MSKFSRLSSVVFVVVLSVVSNLDTADGFIPNSGAYTATLTYFFGIRASTDHLCYERTVPKGTTTPVTVQYTNPVPARVINFVTVNADRYAKYGFRVNIQNGALATATLDFQLTGKAVLPYNVVFQYWCKTA